MFAHGQIVKQVVVYIAIQQIIIVLPQLILLKIIQRLVSKSWSDLTASEMVLSFFVLLSAVLFAMYSSGVRGGQKGVRFCLQRLASDEFAEDRGWRDGGDFGWGEFDDVAQELQDARCFSICR